MANFNKKVMCLFNKNSEQVRKEAKRRGINTFCREGSYRPYNELIAEIIWKDAYDAGRSSELNKHCTPVEAPVKDYSFYDFSTGTNSKITLTEEQARVFLWLINNDFLDADFTEWEESDYQNVGRI